MRLRSEGKGAMGMFEKILLAVDGSESAKRAVAATADLASKTKAEVLVVHVHEKGLVSRETTDLETGTEASMLTHAALEVVRKAGVSAGSQMRAAHFEDVAREILDAAEGYGADTIVLGSRGLGTFAELLLGSVAHKVIQLARCPVVVVR